MKIRSLPVRWAVMVVLVLLSFSISARAQDAGTQRFSAAIDGATISYTITGASGPVIFLIHGYPLNGDLFEKQRTALSANYRVVVPDLRGFGSSVAPDQQGSLDLYAGDMLALLDQLGITQAIIGGHSLGGAITLRMYQMQPQRFLGMLLIDAAAMPPPIVEQYLWLGYQQQSMALGAPSLVPLLLPEFLTGKTRSVNTELVSKVETQINQASLNGLVGGAKALQTRPDLRPVFPTIAVPTLIIFGQEDSLTPMEQAMQLRLNIINSDLTIIPGASHGAIREAAGTANAAIKLWLSTNFGTE